MMPVAPLMAEHRLIERMIKDMSLRLNRFVAEKVVDTHYVEMATDFVRTYADSCHHGKEEDILFRELGKDRLSPELQAIMNELIAEHKWARSVTASLFELNAQYAAGRRETFGSIERVLRELMAYYPVHIRKEEELFFHRAMTYLSDEEQSAILDEFRDFDRMLIHVKYRKVVEALEAGHLP